MNAFLARFALPPLALRDADRPPGTANLVAAEALAPADGLLVSVVMTAYNTAERIGAALASVLAQTWRNLEVVVVDDCSTDATAEVVQALAEQDPRVKYLRLACNAGTYVAKTVGLRHAKGEFVTCHDSDDWSHPLRIERQMRPLLDNRRLVASTSQWVRIEDDGTYYARPVHPLSRLNPASPLFRRQEVLAQAGLWDAVRTGADSEFHSRLRLVFGRQAVYRLAQPLAFGAHRADSLMNAADTGYSVAGLSPQRLAYWESWTRWHIAELHAGRKPVMPAMGTQSGDATERLLGTRVPHDVVRACLEAAGVC
jgi:glycosyltransferase involved in cell wall biosynthesis